MQKVRARGQKLTTFWVAAAAVASGFVLLLTALTVFGVVAARNVPGAVHEAFTLRIELADSLSVDDVRDLKGLLSQRADIDSLVYLSRADRTEVLADSVPDADLVAHNPLPDLLLVTFAPDFITPDNLRDFKTYVEADRRVRAALYAPDMASISAGFLPMASLAAWVLLAGVCLLAFFAVWHGARLVRRVRRDYEHSVGRTGELLTAAFFSLPPIPLARLFALLSVPIIGVPAVLLGLFGRKKERIPGVHPKENELTTGDDFVEDI